MRTPVHDDVTLPPLPLARVVEHRDAAGRLHDPLEPAKVGYHGRHAPIRQTAVFRTVEAILACDVVKGRRVVIPWRGLRVVLPAGTGSLLVLARLSGLHKGQTILSIPLGEKLCLRHDRGNSPVRWVHNQRRTPPRVPHRGEDRVVRAGDILFGAPLYAYLAAEKRRSLLIENSPFFRCEELLVRKLLGPLQGRL